MDVHVELNNLELETIFRNELEKEFEAAITPFINLPCNNENRKKVTEIFLNIIAKYTEPKILKLDIQLGIEPCLASCTMEYIL